MREKTDTRIVELKLFLASNELTLRVNRSMTIGRDNRADIILDDDEHISGMHCQITPAMLALYITDLGSVNGVYVNKERILPMEEVKLSAGDEVQIGKRRFVFLDDEEELKKRFPHERRKHPRPKNLWGPINIFNFYCAPLYWKAIYLMAILLTMRSFIWNGQLTTPLPENLQFLSKIYHEQIFLSGLKLTFLVWGLSLLHSFLLTVYFNRNNFRKFISGAMYVAALVVSVDFKDGPLWNYKTYVEARHAIKHGPQFDKPIVRLKFILDNQHLLQTSFKATLPKLNGESRRVLMNDYRRLVKDIHASTLTINDKPKISEVAGEE